MTDTIVMKCETISRRLQEISPLAYIACELPHTKSGSKIFAIVIPNENTADWLRHYGMSFNAGSWVAPPRQQGGIVGIGRSPLFGGLLTGLPYHAYLSSRCPLNNNFALYSVWINSTHWLISCEYDTDEDLLRPGFCMTLHICKASAGRNIMSWSAITKPLNNLTCTCARALLSWPPLTVQDLWHASRENRP